MTLDIRNNKEKSQFETTVDGHVAAAAYDLEEPNRIVFTHTDVPEALAGRGIAGEIVKYGLDHAREKKLTVVPQCSYVAAYIKRHPEYQDLLP
ncbi:MAG TPA: GNAT family N-acetyltransferase [Thermoanaerobaculia bacterium]|jgi:predicted GNAT family acetyltransferase|nr:GNAT family N-acetyltransferase [Thermoanaerobaculia bacterium]